MEQPFMPDSAQPHFFNPRQRATIEAAMARVIPTDDTPGATEAGCIEFLDRYLSGLGYIYAKPDGSGFETLTGAVARAWTQRIEILRAKYIAGVEALDQAARVRFAADFTQLNAAQQDDILKALETVVSHAASPGGAPGEGPALQQTSTETELEFFPLLVMHTRQGFYCDPIYGGNKDHVGWGVIGFPGPKSLSEVFTGRYSALPWFAEGEADKYREANHGV
jgi:gluconate 2-dehydrogenase gamma chain